MKIRLKLILSFVFVIVVTASLYGLSSYLAMSKPIQAFEQDYRTKYNRLIFNQINRVLDHVLDDADHLSRQDLIRFIQDPEHSSLHPEKDPFNLFRREYIQNVIYHSRDGRNLYALNHVGEGALANADRKLSILPMKKPTRSLLRISRNYFNPDGSLEGTGFIFLDLDRLFHSLILIGTADKTCVCLREPSGTLLYSTSDEPLEGGSSRIPPPPSQATQRYAEGRDGPSHTSELPGKPGNVLMSGSLIPALGIPLLVEAHITGLKSPVSSMPLNMLMLGMAVIWVSVWIAMVIGYRIMKPIEDLSHGAERIASGEYDYRLKYRGSDEISLLSQKFNEMAAAVGNRTRELKQSNLELKAQDAQKTRFLDIVAHDLRTPLTSIKAYADLILRFPGEDEKTKREFLEIILQESERMSSLINDYLDLTKLENGTLAYRFRETDLEEMIRECEQINKGECLLKKLRIMSDIKHPLPLIEADPERLRQVFSNLLSNAIRYSPPGGEIRIEADRVMDDSEQEAGREWIEVTVRDQGPGIPDEYREVIFDKFRQIDTKSLHSKGGAGLGLPISREIITKHSGKIWAEKNKGAGAVFKFRVPVHPSSPLN